MATKTTKKKTKSKTKKRKKKSALKKKFNALLKNKRVIAIVAIIAAVLCIITVAAVNGRNTVPQAYEFDKEVACGIDVSSHNGKIDWDKVAETNDFAFIRVGCRGYSKGNVFLDKRAKYNMKHAEKAKIPFGVYIYSQAITVEEAEEEAEFLLRHIKGYNVQLPLVFDFEYAYKNGNPVGRLANASLTKKDRTAMINAFCKVVKDAGYVPALYASTYIYESQIYVNRLEKGTVIWVADYNKKITYKGRYDIWQATNKGTCRGVNSKNVDIDYWYTDKD